MNRLGCKCDSLSVSGIVIGFISLFLSWCTVKPNRIAAGTGLKLYQLSDSLIFWIIIILWFICLYFAFSRNIKITSYIHGICANIILVISFYVVGSSATDILKLQEPFTRISLSIGFWLSFIAIYVLIYSCRQRIRSRLPKDIITWSGASFVVIMLIAGWFNDISVIQEYASYKERFFQEFGHHIFLVGISVACGTIMGIILGITANRNIQAAKPIFFVTNITQTIPSLALFGLLIAPLSVLSFKFPFLRQLGIRGVGDAPAIIALTIYSLLPIVRNTYAGLQQVDNAVINTGIGMGMNRSQVFKKIELPLAAPLILEGVRISSVQSVGLTAVAALIGAGGLGWFIFQGLGQAAADMILLGAIPIIILALLVDALMRIVVKLVTPRGLTGGDS